MIDVASYLGADPSLARAEMLDVLKFEISLANFSLPREERRNASKLYNPMRIRDLSNFDPNTPWLEYINNILTPDIIQVGCKTCTLKIQQAPSRFGSPVHSIQCNLHPLRIRNLVPPLMTSRRSRFPQKPSEVLRDAACKFHAVPVRSEF